MRSASQKTSLEWFFTTPSAANFPQAFLSPALSTLQSDFSRLVDSLFNLQATAELTSEQRLKLVSISKEALLFSHKLREGFDSETAQSLTSVLRVLGEALKENKSSTELDFAVRNFREVLGSLVVYARESTDHSFKKSVLDLVRQFEANNQ